MSLDGAHPSQLEAANPLATLLPREYYISQTIYEREIERVFLGQWTFLGHVSEIPEPGSFIRHDLLGESVIVVRQADGSVRGHLNVCRHRGHSVCQETRGKAKSFVCPYHQWAYELDGSLKRAPGFKDGEGMRYAEHGLKSVRVEVWNGFVFGWLGDERAPPLDECFGRSEAMERLDTANMKELQLYPGMMTGSMTGGLIAPPLGEFAGRTDLPEGYGAGVGVLPSLSRIIVHIDHGFVHFLRPSDVGHVRWETRWYVRGDAVEGRDYDKDAVTEVWRRTNGEDISLCENAYRGVCSRRYTPGPLHPQREGAIRSTLDTYLTLMGEANT